MYSPVFFLSVSVALVVPPRLGTGTQSGGNGIFVLSPFAVEPIVALATTTVLISEILSLVAATLRNARTVEAVVEASFAMIERLSTIAPSLAEQSIINVHPAPVGVFRSVESVIAA